MSNQQEDEEEETAEERADWEGMGQSAFTPPPHPLSRVRAFFLHIWEHIKAVIESIRARAKARTH
jgi:hypothetical protein